MTRAPCIQLLSAFNGPFLALPGCVIDGIRFDMGNGVFA